MDSASPESPIQPVSALRSKFENLAREKSPAAAPPKSERGDLLSPGTRSPRQRAQSDADADAQLPSSSTHSLRPASSSSDLKAAKRPPPPPPSRPPKVASPVPISPLLRPVPVPTLSVPPSSLEAGGSLSAADKAGLLARKPPPTPPPRTGEPSAAGLSSGGVASLRSKFTTNASPSLPSTRPKASGSRVVSLSSTATNPSTLPPSSDGRTGAHTSHSHRHSIATVPLVNTQPHISERSSILDDEAEYEFASPTPIPSRYIQSGAHSRDPSSESSEPLSANSTGGTSIDSERSVPPRTPQPKRPTIQPPPRPPPRHGSSIPSSSSETASGSETTPNRSTPTLVLPPPLPARRSPPASIAELPRRPHLPIRPPVVPQADPHTGSASAPPTTDRKMMGSGKVAPPPTRTIALGDKLPPARRLPGGGSSSSSGDEDEPAQKSRTLDLLPDATRSSRRPPLLTHTHFPRFHAHVPAHTGVVAVAGNHVVVAAHHYVNVYDLAVSDAPVHHIELRDVALEWRVKDPRVTSMEFLPAARPAERGALLWLGTKDGHLWELDVRTGAVTDTRAAAHGHAVAHVFRLARAMVSLDEGGKALVFAPDGAGVLRLAHAQPRVVRIADRQGFARVLGGRLWTSGGPGSGSGAGAGGQANGGAAATAARGPIVRVYDIMSPTGAVKSLLPLENVGAVTSGTVLPSQPYNVYLGHEGGFISIWNLQTDDGVPACTEVVKVSASDVLCLEGVNDRLWAGGRKGTISAYDVEYKPWLVTNCWSAHLDLPVQRIVVDPWSIEKCGQLSVVSVGRDEQARLWDGFLGLDWIDAELMKREASFSTFRAINALIVSWNVDAAKPDALTGNADNVGFLESALRSVDSPDIIVFGFQEMIDLENRKMAAKTVLLGGKKKAPDGSISEKVSRSYKMWHDRLVLAVRLAMPAECPYTVVHTENLVGLFTCIFVKQAERAALKDAAIVTVKRGMGGRYGNKGGIIARFVMDDSSICFINCHLAAGQKHTRIRNADIAAILEEKSVFPMADVAEPLAYVGGGDGSMILDHELVFLHGDLNYRIDQRRDTVVAAVHTGDLSSLLVHDQLLKEMKFNRGFRLRSFMEATITFAPTYKYDRKSSEYDSSEKNRIPAWCDRILYRARQPDRVEALHYRRYEANVSDHRPISAGFRATVKSVKHDVRARVKNEVEELWLLQEHKLLFAAREFYASQEII